MDTYQPGEFIFQCPIFLPFHTVHGVLNARILKWFAIPFSGGPRFAVTLHHDPSSCVALHSIAYSFIELDKAVVHVIRLVSFLSLWLSVIVVSVGLLKKQESSRKTSISALLTMPKPLTVWITKTVENSERDGNTRSLYLSPEKPVCGSRSNS